MCYDFTDGYNGYRGAVYNLEKRTVIGFAGEGAL